MKKQNIIFVKNNNKKLYKKFDSFLFVLKFTQINK